MFLTGFEPRSNQRREGINIRKAGLQGHRAEVVFRDTRENSESRLSQIFSQKLEEKSQRLEATVGVSRETFRTLLTKRRPVVRIHRCSCRFGGSTHGCHSGLLRKTRSDDATEGGPRALMCQSKENLLDLTHNMEVVNVTLGRKNTRKRVV